MPRPGMTTTNNNRALQDILSLSAATTPDDDAAADVLGRATTFNPSAVVAADDALRLFSLEEGDAAATAADPSSKKPDDDMFGLLLEGDAAADTSWRGDSFDSERKQGCRRGGLLDRYAKNLEARPLQSKCVTSAVVGAFGDLLTQGMFWARGGGGVWHDTQVSYSRAAVDYNNSK